MRRVFIAAYLMVHGISQLSTSIQNSDEPFQTMNIDIRRVGKVRPISFLSLLPSFESFGNIQRTLFPF